MSDLPNIIISTWHDTGQHFGCYGQKTVQSPNVDAFAADGVVFENCFCSSPKCSPSRGSCMTGKYPQSNGLYYLCHGNFGYRFDESQKHLAQLLKERGYYSVLHGFHHECPVDETERLGHDERHNYLPAPPIYPCPPCDVIANDAAAWLKSEASQNKPFFMQLGFFETHRDYNFGGCEPDDELGVDMPRWVEDSDTARADTAAFQGAIKKADHNFGVVMQALEEAGLADNTIVLFTVDHGVDMPGAKGSCYEPGLEIAGIMRWPKGGINGGKRSERLVSNVDFVPTLFELAGLEFEPGTEGVSFADEFSTPRSERQRAHVFGMIEEGEKRSVRNKRFKLIRYFKQLRDFKRPIDFVGQGSSDGDRHGAGTVAAVPACMLFDLVADPLETQNLYDDPAHADVQKELDTALWQWMESVNDPLLTMSHYPRWRMQLRDYLLWKYPK